METNNQSESPMNGDGLAAPNEKGSVTWSIPSNFDESPAKATEGGDDNGSADDYHKLDDRNAELMRARSAADVAMPWVVWPVFVISIIVGSSSAAVIVTMKRAAHISLAAWRQQISCMGMLPFFLVQCSKLPKCDRARALSAKSLGLYFACSLALAVHFACYLWSLNHTSMVHCLFLICMSPIFVAIYTVFSGGRLLTGEYIGVALGLFGVGILAGGTRVESDNQSTHLGDFVALSGSIFMAAYLIINKQLRSWMPLFVFQFPVCLLVSILLGIAGLLLEGWNESAVGNISGPFSWMRKDYVLKVVFLGIGPGLIGHAGYSFVLRYSSPLVMPTGLSIQPVIGSVLGWAVGESSIPGLWSCLGGAVTLTGTLFVSFANAKKAKPENKEEEYKQPAAFDEEGQQATKSLLQSSDHE